MSDRLMALAEQLAEADLTGQGAFRYGSPDRVMLISGGPASHLAQWSMMAGPPSYRVSIRQPTRDTLPKAEQHSPLSDGIRLAPMPDVLIAEVEEWKHGSWYHRVRLRAKNLGDMMEKLQPLTSKELFQQTLPDGCPQRPFWSGALAYDLVQWTQPIRLQHPPEEGALLAVLWYVDNGVVEDRHSEMVIPFGLNMKWVEACGATLEEPWKELVIPEAKPGRESSTHTDETHEENIRQIQQGIVAGQVYQVNVGKHWQGDIDHPYRVFQRLTQHNPAPFSAYVEADDLGFALASSSPESLLACDGISIRTSPIKGTCPRGDSPEESAAYRTAMLENDKERAEHRMLVDLMRNDLTRVCQPGTVGVDRFDVEVYTNVQHLVSHISGILRPEASGQSAIQAVFPGGSITGCPRTMVCAAIDEVEQMPRSFWTGSIGWMDVHTGASAWNILIRTLEAKRNGRTWSGSVGAGGGITIGSEPEKEVEEAAWKAAALRLATGWITAEQSNVSQGELELYPIEQGVQRKTSNSTGSMFTLEQALQSSMVGGVLFIENLDSFSYNIVNAVTGLGHDAIIMQARSSTSAPYLNPVNLHNLLEALQPSHLILGPGPGTPLDADITVALAHHALAGQLEMPVLGICLGHQALALADGYAVVPSPLGPVHGSPVAVEHQNDSLFSALDSPVMLTRYNSLIIQDNATHTLEVSAREMNTGLPMGLVHPTLPIHSLQIHPESVGSEHGMVLIRQFLQIQSDG